MTSSPKRVILIVPSVGTGSGEMPLSSNRRFAFISWDRFTAWIFNKFTSDPVSIISSGVVSKSGEGIITDGASALVFNHAVAILVPAFFISLVFLLDALPLGPFHGTHPCLTVGAERFPNRVPRRFRDFFRFY